MMNSRNIPLKSRGSSHERSFGGVGKSMDFKTNNPKN
jgi:hypothetical protein